jgi:hypothetical protein
MLVIVIAQIGEGKLVFLIATHDRDIFDVAGVQHFDLPFEDALALDVQKGFGPLLDEGQQVRFKARREDDGPHRLRSRGQELLLGLLHVRHADEVIHLLQRGDMGIEETRHAFAAEQGKSVLHGGDRCPDGMIGEDDELESRRFQRAQGR